MASGKPQQPPQMAQWENWTFSWLICFCLVVWGGIFLLETYSVKSLEAFCPVNVVDSDGGPAKGIVPALLQMRKIVYGILIFITFVPLYMAWSQRRKWGSQYHDALNKYNAQMFGNPANATNTPAYDAKSPENLSPEAGGYSPQTGSTRLFDATYSLAELVGYASPNVYGDASHALPRHHGVPSEEIAPDDFDLEAFEN